MTDTPSQADYRIERLRQAGPALDRALPELIEQLSPGRAAPEAAAIDSILTDDRLHWLVAYLQDGTIGGMIVLVLYDVPTGRRARIEDLVVASAARGGGLGEALLRRALAIARHEGAGVVDLTSNPSRRAAHGLYRKLGFQHWETDVYRLILGAG